MSTPSERAALRRRTWRASTIRCGDPKGALYTDLTPSERLLAFTRLNERVWASAGVHRALIPRSSWPGEILEIRRRG